MASAAKTTTDWEAIETAFRNTQESPRQLAERFGAQHTAISKRAKEHGWTRDVSGKVRQRAAERLLLSDATPAPEKLEQAVEAAAECMADVVVAHRKQISTARGIVNRLLNEIADTKALHAMTTRASSITALANAMKVLIALERQAFGMDVAEPEKPIAAEGLTMERRKAALALLLSRE